MIERNWIFSITYSPVFYGSHSKLPKTVNQYHSMVPEKIWNKYHFWVPREIHYLFRKNSWFIRIYATFIANGIHCLEEKFQLKIFIDYLVVEKFLFLYLKLKQLLKKLTNQFSSIWFFQGSCQCYPQKPQKEDFVENVILLWRDLKFFWKYLVYNWGSLFSVTFCKLFIIQL